MRDLYIKQNQMYARSLELQDAIKVNGDASLMEQSNKNSYPVYVKKD